MAKFEPSKIIGNRGVRKFVKQQLNSTNQPKSLAHSKERLVSTAVENLYKELPKFYRRKLQTTVSKDVSCKNDAPLCRLMAEEQKQLMTPPPPPPPANLKKKPNLHLFSTNGKNASFVPHGGVLQQMMHTQKLLKPATLRQQSTHDMSSSASSSRSSIMRRLDSRKKMSSYIEPLQRSYLQRAYSSKLEVDRRLHSLKSRQHIAPELKQELNEVATAGGGVKPELMPVSAMLKKRIQVKSSKLTQLDSQQELHKQNRIKWRNARGHESMYVGDKLQQQQLLMQRNNGLELINMAQGLKNFNSKAKTERRNCDETEVLTFMRNLDSPAAKDSDSDQTWQRNQSPFRNDLLKKQKTIYTDMNLKLLSQLMCKGTSALSTANRPLKTIKMLPTTTTATSTNMYSETATLQTMPAVSEKVEASHESLPTCIPKPQSPFSLLGKVIADTMHATGLW